MIINKMNDGKNIYKAWRNEDGERQFEKVRLAPYFYVKDSHIEPKEYSASKFLKRDFEYAKGNWVNLQGEKLKRVYVDSAHDIRKIKDAMLPNGNNAYFNETYEADVPLHFRYCVDELDEMPEYKLRKWYWDMEWQQGGDYHDQLTTIVAYDNYDEQYYQWVWFPEFNEDFMDNIENCDKKIFSSEKDMIEDFLTTMIVKDPDMLIAWFGHFADLPKLFERACAVGLDPSIISPIGYVKGVSKTKDGFSFKYAEKGFSPIEQPIGGRITLSLDLAFERQWNDSQRGTLPSLSLDYIGESVLNKNKLVSERFPDSNEFYRRAWLEDTETYLKYALRDVELMVEIDEKNFCSEAILSLQRLLKAPFDACFYASHMGSIYFMRNATWKAPTGRKVEKRKE